MGDVVPIIDGRARNHARSGDRGPEFDPVGKVTGTRSSSCETVLLVLAEQDPMAVSDRKVCYQFIHEEDNSGFAWG